MPVIMAVNGVMEGYRPNFGSAGGQSSRKKRPPGGSESDHEQPEVVDSVLLAVQHAYQQPPQPPPQKKPAVLARDIMHAPVSLLSPEAQLTDAWTLMQTKGFRHIPIVSAEGRLVGIVSDRDLLRFSRELGEGTAPPQRIGQIMQTNVLTATLTTEITEIARVMLDERVHALPIIDDAHRPIGILTSSDLLRSLVNRAPLEIWT
ncbi:MAG: CBS domain-containing protein [Nitrospira sp.]|nr:CBS domain-containing protein [Nitrospira sp.]